MENSFNVNFQCNTLDQQIRGKNNFATEVQKDESLVATFTEITQRGVTQRTQESETEGCSV